MLDFFKKMGQGALTIIALPLIAIILAGAFIWALITYLIMLFKAIFIFFRGGKLFAPTARDKAAADIILKRSRAENVPAATTGATQQPLYINNANFYGAQLPPGAQFNNVRVQEGNPQQPNQLPPGYSGQLPPGNYNQIGDANYGYNPYGYPANQPAANPNLIETQDGDNSHHSE